MVSSQDVWVHLESIKSLVLLTTPRGGSDFFQTLVDGHDEVLMMPGQFQFFDFWNEARCKDNVALLAKQFCWHHKYISRFRSYCETFERWGNLGPDCNEAFVVDDEIFTSSFCELMRDKEITAKTVMLAIHAAYFAATNRDVLKTKLLFWHVHEHYWMSDVRSHFVGYDIIYCTRDPRNTFVSLYNNLILKYHPDSITALGFWSNWVVEDFRQLFIKDQSENISILPLENLHLKRAEVLGSFNLSYGLSDSECYARSTIRALDWWGDAASGKKLPVTNLKIADPKWHGELWWSDVLWIECLMQWHFEHLPYKPAIELQPRIKSALSLLLCWVPLKYEVDTALRLWKVRNDSRVSSVINFIVRGYLKRVLFTVKKNLKGWSVIKVGKIYGTT